MEPIPQTERESAMDKTIDYQQNKTTTTNDQQQASFVYEEKPAKKTTTDYSSIDAKPYEPSK